MLKLFKFTYKLFVYFLSKKYLRNSKLIEELNDTLENVDRRVRPLSSYAVKKFEQLAFTPMKNRAEISKNMKGDNNTCYIEAIEQLKKETKNV